MLSSILNYIDKYRLFQKQEELCLFWPVHRISTYVRAISLHFFTLEHTPTLSVSSVQHTKQQRDNIDHDDDGDANDGDIGGCVKQSIYKQ